MSPEERLDRLEALARFFRLGEQRRRRSLREQDEKIDILLNMHIQSEDRFNSRFERIEELFAKNEERFAKNEERFAKNEERFETMQQSIDRLVVVQSRTNEQLQTLIDALRRTNLGGLFA